MKYKVGMSDKKTRAKYSGANNPHSYSSFRNKLTKDQGKVNRLPNQKVKRDGFRKFSKIGIFGKGIKNDDGKTSRNRIGIFDKRKKFWKFVKKAFTFGISFGVICAVIGSIAVGVYLKSLGRSLPSPDKLIVRDSDQSTIIYDRNKVELWKIYGDENRQFVKIEDIPEHTRWALLAAEDVEFYEHKGMDWKGIIRCGFISVKNYAGGGSFNEGCGASTITQQLVRNTLMYDVFGAEAFERDSFYKAIRRKLREILLSMQVEQNFTKDEILQMYMNEIPLGGVNYGYEAAAQSYFGKSVKELSLAESALIAGLIQSPSIYSPLFGVNPELSEDRQEYVFKMLEKHADIVGIAQEDIDAAREEVLVYDSGDIDLEAYHFVFYVKNLLEQKYGADVVESGGLKVYTTLDLSLQKIAQEEITNGVATYGHRFGVYNGGMVVLDPKTGQILAMVGSVDHNEIEDPRIDGNVNVTTSLRQMGSSFKPYVYLTAFEKYGPWLEAPDIPMGFGAYKPLNSDERYFGPMVAREALIKSRNIPAIYTLQYIGIDATIKTAEKLGITTLKDRDQYGLSMAIGAVEQTLLEHAQAYSVFATGGVLNEATPILKVTDSKGETLEEFIEGKGKRVFDEKDVYLLNWVLCDAGGFADQPNNKYYFINGRRGACGKTGTTNGPKDLVAMQYNKNIVVGIWMGNNNGKEVPGAWSTTVPLPVANSFMNRVAGKFPVEMPTRPAGILATTVCNETGLTASADNPCKKVPSVYVSGRASAKDTREKIYICKSNGLVATNLAQAQQFTDLLEVKTIIDFKIHNILQQATYSKYLQEKTSLLTTMPSSGLCPLPLGPNNEPVVIIDSPTSGASFTSGSAINIKTTTWADTSIQSVEFYFNGSLIGTDTSASYEYTYTTSPSLSSGTYTILAKVTDANGKVGTDSVLVTITNVSPITVTITSPNSGAILSKNVDQIINATITNVPSGSIATAKVSGPNGYTWGADMVLSGGFWTVNWVAHGLEVGAYTISVGLGGVTNSVNVMVLEAP